jgi:Flp pilus assembly pilin Flp
MQQHHHHEDGQVSLEYALMLVVAIGMVTALAALAAPVADFVAGLAEAIASAV